MIWFGDFLAISSRAGSGILLVFLFWQHFSHQKILLYLIYLFLFALLLTTSVDFELRLPGQGFQWRSLACRIGNWFLRFHIIVLFFFCGFWNNTCCIGFLFPKDLFFFLVFFLFFSSPHRQALLEGVFRGESHFSSPAGDYSWTGCLATAECWFSCPMLGLFGAILPIMFNSSSSFVDFFLRDEKIQIVVSYSFSYFLKNF